MSGDYSMKIYQYEDYEDYVKKQTFHNRSKINWIYVKKSTIDTIVKDKQSADNILCHGTRRGAEQEYFKKHFPNAYIIGTEISDTASQFPMTIQHDFTFPKEEWINKFDIVYSNSIDHSIDPLQTILTWKDQLVKDGRLYLEYSEDQSICTTADPLMATNDEIKQLIDDAGLIIIQQFGGNKNNGIVFICEKKGI